MLPSHEQLRRFAQQIGLAAFDDAPTLRALLDDLLDEDAMAAADVALVVEAARHRTMARLRAEVRRGRPAEAAVDAAGADLARALGPGVGRDPAGPAWACAALAYAAGWLEEPTVQRYAAARGSLGASTWTGAVVVPPPAPTGPPAPSWAARRPDPRSPATRPRGDRLRWVLAAALAVVLVTAGGVATYLLARDDAGGQDPGASGSSGSTSSGSPDAEGVEAYAALGPRLGDSLAECAEGDAAGGESGRLACVVSDPGDADEATATLVTYEDEAALEDGRDEVVDHEIGTRYSAQDAGVFWSFQDVRTGAVQVWWDDVEALQSVHLVGTYAPGSSAELSFEPVDALESLVGVFEGAGSAVEYPDAIEDEGVAQLAEDFTRDDSLDLASCAVRGQHFDPGELEENRCASADGSLVVFLVRSADAQAQEAYRNSILTAARADRDGTVDVWMRPGSPGDVPGAWIHYRQADRAYVYWEDEECLCYGFALRPDGDLDALLEWWIGPQ
ncbi:hypothetical protein RDV89_15075 [Nocardioides zeae]|uniref:Uncharacterized protein n=1 Tax=Nocardioides imazamoxiresistens TaxID=3231893 RepID=A0ABU3Q073_9ACTN|nr:hypothetical protein [Nocardioides zeae]MDT9594405.1 hypothetical protein [Nocardioides zeae]